MFQTKKKILVFLSALLLTCTQFAHAQSITINGQQVSADDLQGLANQIESGDINPNSISEEEFDQLTPSQQQQIVDAYNEQNNTNLSPTQFQTEVSNTANNTSSNEVTNTTNEVLNDNPSVRDAINDPANANTEQLQQEANLTDAQISEIQQAQEELRRQEQETARRAAELQAQQASIDQTQSSIDSLNSSVSSIDSQTSDAQNSLNATNTRIAELERQAAEANANGDLEAFNQTQDEIETARQEEIAQNNELKRLQQDKAIKEEEIERKQKTLADQERQRSIKQAEVDASKSAEDNLKAGIAQTVIDGVSEQSVTNFVGDGDADVSTEGDNAPTVGEVLGVIQEEQENGNITVDEEGNIQVDQEAIIANQNQDNPEGYCTDDGFCVSNERAVEGAMCKLKNEEEQASCLQEVSRNATKDYIKGGSGCQASADPKAVACREAGRTYNCEFGQCLSDEQMNQLADQGGECMNKPKEERDACFKEVKMTAVENGAKGEYCLKDTQEAKACESGGKNWNCNMDMCVDDIQNDTIADAVVQCQSKENKIEAKRCMDELEENGAYLLASACEEAQSPKGEACAADGNIWNCGANACVTPDMNGRLVESFKRCQNKPTQELKDQCMGELDEIAAAASDNQELTEDDFESPGSPASVGYAVVGAIGSLAASVAAGGICIGAVVNAAAGVMAIMNEKNSAKSADQQLSSLKERFRELEKRMDKDVISFEIQREAIDFYIQALTTSISIADNYAKGYDQSGNMFGIAAAIAAVEAIIWLPKPPAWPGDMSKVICAGIAAGSAATGMILSSKASGIARGMADDFRDQKSKLERIRDLFDKHFGKSGGITTLASARGYGSASPVGTNGSITQATATRAPGDNGSEIGEDGNQASLCADKDGNVDESCSCKANNSCFSLNPNLFEQTKIGRDISKKLDVEGSFNETNSIASGSLTASSLNGGQLAARFKRTRKAVKSLFEQVNNKMKKAKRNDNFAIPSNAELAKFVNKAMPPEKRIGGSSKFLGSMMGDINPSEIKETERALSSNIKDGKVVEVEGGIKTPLGTFKPPKIGKIEELDAEELDTLEKIKDQGIVNSELTEKDLIEVEDVHESTTKSLWNILTRRYHVITRQKRIGKLKTRRVKR